MYIYKQYADSINTFRHISNPDLPLFTKEQRGEVEETVYVGVKQEPDHFHGEIEADTRGLTVDENLDTIWCSEEE